MTSSDDAVIVVRNDGPTWPRVRPLGKYVVALVAIESYFVAAHANWVWGASAAGAWVLLSLFVFTARNRWGDELIFDDQSMKVVKRGAVVDTVPRAKLVVRMNQPETVAFAWVAPSTFNRSILLGREAFTESTWEHLTKVVADLERESDESTRRT